MPDLELDILKTAAIKAGEIALSYYGQGPHAWEKEGELGPVSEADLAVNDFLIEFFARELPDCAILSEETEDNHNRLGAKRLLVIDPIDGTKAFLNREDFFAISIGLLDEGEVTHAAINAPARGELFYAQKGQGAFCNQSQLKVSDCHSLSKSRILASRAKYNRHVLEALHLETSFRPSIALRMAYVAQGQFDLTISLRPSWDWDVIAGDLLIQEAGGLTLNSKAQTPLYNQPLPQQNGIIAGAPAVVRKLLAEMETIAT